MLCIYRSLLYGWSLQWTVTEARKIIQEIKSNGVAPDLICYNTFLRCLCKQNLRYNPSGLVPEALNVIMEMKSYKRRGFEKGRELWDEATSMGISLQCSRDVLDPSITEVLIPKRPEKISLEDSTIAKPPKKVKEPPRKWKLRRTKSASMKKKKKK
ncbi:hypothetical protein PIB30_033265 [Stylosanthes scabra]|uniref:Pentatricopeptide repeat-containing protein n=1 Tax=Stylosanthes scabra TaxID=79078 RepID=A0ABU6YBF5_9FABA|nr:hypothetical protein [Stylosanthes scabra]